MSWWLPFLIGLTLGWIIELLIDYFYWRNKRICPEAEIDLQEELAQVERENKKLKVQLEGFAVKGQTLTGLEKDLQTRQLALNNLTAGQEARANELADLEASLQAQEAKLADRSTQLRSQETALQTREAQLADMASESQAHQAALGALEAKEKQLTQVEARLRAKEAALEQQAQTLTERETELKHARPTPSDTRSALTEISQPPSIEPPPTDQGELIPEEPQHPEQITPKPQSADDLKKLRGIGPKLEQILRTNGLETFTQIAEADLEYLNSILAKAGARFKSSGQETWAEQARLAAEGQWDELKHLQAQLAKKGAG